MNWTQTIILALIQGLSEFLPVSSSAHLILVPSLLGWADQGLAFDVAVHVGTLIAILIYFRLDLKTLVHDCCCSIAESKMVGEAPLAAYIVLATIPVGLFGLWLKPFIENHLRSTQVIAYATIGFGLVLWIADRLSRHARDLRSLGWVDALAIGLGQVLSLIPGTSRSGITLSVGLMRGFSRESAARFSFLMAIPVMTLAGILQCYDLMKTPSVIEWQFLIGGVCVAGLSGYVCIHYFLRLINRVGLWPFVLYRLCLGLALLNL
jgi:undecaprenyl-diphosphatase